MHKTPSKILAAAVLAAAATLTLTTRAADAPPATSATQPTRAPAPPNVLSEKTIAKLDIPYATHDPALNTLDLYAPKDVKAAPTLFFVHGGEWSRGDKQPVSYKPKFFNDNGVIFITTNYRLSPKAPHPAQVDDISEAIAWTRDHIAEFGGDPKKIVILGNSAGCHLVTYIGLNPEPLAKVHMKPSDLAGVVAWSGDVYDLVDRAKAGGTYGPFIKATFGESEDAQRAASPLTYAKNAQSSPKFLIASTDDQRSQSSRDASKKLLDAINANGGSAQAATLAGRDHRAALEQLGAPDDKTGPALLEFIRAVTQ